MKMREKFAKTYEMQHSTNLQGNKDKTYVKMGEKSQVNYISGALFLNFCHLFLYLKCMLCE